MDSKFTPSLEEQGGENFFLKLAMSSKKMVRSPGKSEIAATRKYNGLNYE